jgi:hypothetical protein
VGFAGARKRGALKHLNQNETKQNTPAGVCLQKEGFFLFPFSRVIAGQGNAGREAGVLR